MFDIYHAEYFNPNEVGIVTHPETVYVTLLCRSDSQISFSENNGLIYKELLEVPMVEKIFWTGV